jgi:RHS repeat-associated protein
VTWVEVSGHPPGAVIEFAPAAALSGETTLRLVAGTLADEWGNVNSENTLVFEHPTGAVGVLLDVSPAPQTAPVRTATSSIGNPFLFQGQYFDYPTGLVYKRARFYDPYSGMFLEPDPLGYEDSVNLYAGLQNNPVSMRDPTGLSVLGLFGRANRNFLGKSGLTDLEIQAIANVLARRQESISISIRKFAKYDKNAGRWIDDIDTAGSRRALSEKGFAGKSAGASRTGVKVKNDAYARGTQIEDRAFRVGFGKYKITLFKYQKKIPITSDLDALHVTIDGQFASVKQIRELFGEINREYIKLHKQHFAHMGKKAPKPNPPFQHEAHAHLLHQMGNKVGTRVGKAGYVTIKDIEAIGHPNDAFVITSKKFNNGGTAFEARDLSRDEVTGILQRGLDDFLENRQSLIDEKLALGRLTPDQLKDSGLFDTVRWPGSYDNFTDGVPSLGGLR